MGASAPITSMEFSGLSIDPDKLISDPSARFISKPVQDWTRVCLNCDGLHSSTAIPVCKNWLSENAIGSYEILEYNSYVKIDNKYATILRLVFRFEEESDALLFRLSDPTSLI